MGDITDLLVQMREGNRQAASQVFAQVYAELHRLAASYMRLERPDHTLQTTALVNEAYLRLVSQRQADWRSRAQFFGVAAQIMRRILINHPRARLTDKRGRLPRRVELGDLEVPLRTEPAELLALDAALKRLATLDARQSRVVELRYFGGLSIEQTARILEISARSVKRDWTMAKAWLRGEMEQGGAVKRE